MDPAGAVAERVSYSAYGIARHHWQGDVDGAGYRAEYDLGGYLFAAEKGLQIVKSRTYSPDLERLSASSPAT